jgi:hypothetical protein
MAYTENYRTDPSVAYEGMISDLSDCVILSRTIATAAIGFAKCVKHGSADHTVEAVEAGDTAIFGLTIRHQALDAEHSDEFPVGETAPILVKGAIWVKAAGTVSNGDPVHVNVTTNAYTTGAGAGKVALEGAFYETSGAADDLVRIRIL